MSTIFSVNDIIKYFIMSMILYSILKMIPSIKIINKDLILLLFIILLSIISFDFIFLKHNIFEKFENEKENITEKVKENITEKIPVIEKEIVTEKIPVIENVKEHVIEHDTKKTNTIYDKYINILIMDLVDKGLLNSNEVKNINVKLDSKLFNIEEIINSLELIKKKSKNVKDDTIYDELPKEFSIPLGKTISNTWDNEYSILNTDKWKVPMARPPVCINTTPCAVCPSDTSSTHVNLKQWDDSRYVETTKINKKWANNQTNS